MRLLAKNATAPVLALALAMTGAGNPAAQGINDKPRLSPPDAAPAKPAAAPERDAGAKAAPLAREIGRSASAPTARAPAVQAPGRSRESGLAGDYWRGVPFAIIAEGLARLPIRVTSPALRALTIEVLTAPLGPGSGGWMAARLAALRGDRLYAMGQLEAAEAAFRAAAIASGDLARAPAQIETKLLLHGPAAACATVAAHAAVRRSLYLERATIACRAFAGAHAEAVARLGHLRELGFAVGEMFGGLVMAQQPELARPLVRLRGADAWSVRLLAETALPWPEDTVRLGAPGLLRAVAASANGPLAVRIGAAERAFVLGAIDRAALVSLYGAMRFSTEALDKAARHRPSSYTPVKRALLFQAAMLADPPARIAILANWWHLARAERGELLAALVVAPLVNDIAPGAAWGENALTICRVLFHAGDLERGLAWYGRLRGAAVKDMESMMRLGAIAQLAETGGKALTAAEAEAWAAYQRGQEAGARRIALLEALARGLAARRHTELSSKNARPGESQGAGARSADRPPADWREIRMAAATGRQGEAILQMLTALGHDGVARAEPHALGAAVGVLAMLGRGAEARRLAVEAALANGF